MVDIDKCVNSAGVDDQGLVFVVCLRIWIAYDFRTALLAALFILKFWNDHDYDLFMLDQVGAMAHGKINEEYADDFISGNSHLN